MDDEPARLWFHNVVNGWRAGSSFALVRFESATHCVVSPQLVRSTWVKSLSCLFMDIWYVTPLLLGPRLKKGPFVLFQGQAVYSESEVWYAASRFVIFREERVITERKNISGKIWFFQNYCRTVYSMFLMTFFSENDFVRERKIVPWGKNTVKVKQAWGKWQYFKCGGNRMGKRRQNTKFRTFYRKSRGETNSISHNTSVINNRTFFEDNFFEMLCKKTNPYYFQNQGMW
jgi:hypothetical protein